MKRLWCLVALATYPLLSLAAKPAPAPFWGVALEGLPLTPNLEAATQQQQIKPQIVLFFQQWDPPDAQTTYAFPKQQLEAIWSFGALPCITWEPMYFIGKTRMPILAKDILAGLYDHYINGYAIAARNWGRPLIIRFAHEMNLAEYHWGVSAADYTEQNPSLYVAMYCYVVERFREQGAHNVLWAFCPNADSVPNAQWNHACHYYPGDSYVDILGMDGYNWHAPGDEQKPRSFKSIFAPLRQELTKLAPHKPLCVFETSTVGPPEYREAWLADAVQTAQKWGLKSVIWFHVNKERDWRMAVPPNLHSAFSEKSGAAQHWAAKLLGD